MNQQTHVCSSEGNGSSCSSPPTTDERTTWLVVTRWRDEEAFQAWMRSPAFGHGHHSAAERAGGPAQPAVGISSELWSYEVAGGSPG